MKRTIVLTAICLVVAARLGNASQAKAVVERQITFKSGSAQISGTEFTPGAPGRHTAMVLMPGSGDETREPLVAIAHAFAERGLVTVVYDKQGNGKSTGDWRAESLVDLANDAEAGIELLRSEGTVDPDRVGAWGISQSGWVLPLLAKRDPKLAFIICVTGGGSRPRDVEYFGYRNRLLHNGYSESDWAAARPLVDQYMDYLASGNDRERLMAALDAADAQPWAAKLGLRRVLPSAEGRESWAMIATYDPAADIQALRQPVLVLLGGRDPFTDTADAFQRWTQNLAATGNPNDRVLTFPTAGHGVRLNGHDMTTAPVFAPGYLEEQFAWLRQIGELQ